MNVGNDDQDEATWQNKRRGPKHGNINSPVLSFFSFNSTCRLQRGRIQPASSRASHSPFSSSSHSSSSVHPSPQRIKRLNMALSLVLVRVLLSVFSQFP